MVDVRRSVAVLVVPVVVVLGLVVSQPSGATNSVGPPPVPGPAELTAADPQSLVAGASFVPITPCRVVDTRVAPGRLSAGEELEFDVRDGFLEYRGGNPEGCGVPDGAVAVEASFTAVEPAGAGFLRVWRYGDEEPASTGTVLNFTPGQNITNTGTIPISAPRGVWDGSLRLFGASSDLVVDVNGYFITGGPTGFVPVTPCRLVDTRPVITGTLGDVDLYSRLGPGRGHIFQVRDPAIPDGVWREQGGTGDGCGVPFNATAVEIAVTAVNPAGKGFLRALPCDVDCLSTGGLNLPNAGTAVNYNSFGALTNTGAVPLGSTEFPLAVLNFGGATDVVVDVFGYYVPLAGGGRYTSLVPCRIVDTRNTAYFETFFPLSETTTTTTTPYQWIPPTTAEEPLPDQPFVFVGRISERFSPAEIRVLKVAGSASEQFGPEPINPDGSPVQTFTDFEEQGGPADGCGIPSSARAVEVSVTWTEPRDSRGFVQLGPDESLGTTFINYSVGRAVTNTGTISLPDLSADWPDRWWVRNFGGSGHLIIDVQGYFE